MQTSAPAQTTTQTPLHTYHAWYRGRKMEVQAASLDEAQLSAAAQFKARKSHEVNVTLVALAGQEAIEQLCLA